jgi:hypothetical protein
MWVSVFVGSVFCDFGMSMLVSNVADEWQSPDTLR